MNITHRFVVGGAFQALNAAEARHHAGVDDAECELVFLVPPKPRAESETWTIIEAGGWSNVRAIGPANTTLPQWVRKVRNASSLRGESATLRRLYIGDYQTQLCRHAAHGLPAAGEVVVLDDGTATVLVNDHRAARAAGAELVPRLQPQVPRWRYHLQGVVGRALGLRLGELDSVTFFTIYELDPAPSDTVVRHRYEWLRGRFADVEVTDDSLFLGSPLVESAIVDEATYVEMLRRVREAVGGRLSYRPHPREDPERVAALLRDVGMDSPQIDGVVEYGLLSSGAVPARIISNFSTALDTMRVILAGRVAVQSVPIPLDRVSDGWRDRVATLYAELPTRVEGPVETLPVFG